MMKPSRLFWKLFLAFWLATSLTFFAGVGVHEVETFEPDDPNLKVILASEAALLRQFGVESGAELLATWRRPPDQAIGVYDNAGQLLAGSAVLSPAYEHGDQQGRSHSVAALHPPDQL